MLICGVHAGAFSVGCTATGAPAGDRLQHHMADVVKAFEFRQHEARCEWVERPTLLVTRFEYANTFHTMLDWYNTFLAQQVFGKLCIVFRSWFLFCVLCCVLPC